MHYKIIIIEYKRDRCFVHNFFNGDDGELGTNQIVNYCQPYSDCLILISYGDDNPADLINHLKRLELNVLSYKRLPKTENTGNANAADILSYLKRIEDNLKNGNYNRNSRLSSWISGVTESSDSKGKDFPDLKELDKKITSLSDKLSSIESSIKDLHKSRQNESTNPKPIDQQPIKEALDSLSKIKYLVECLYNQSPNQADDSVNAVINDLRKELSSYKNDFYMKSMQKYGVDIAIKIIDRLYNEKLEIEQNHPEETELKERYMKLIDFCQAEFRKLNLKFVKSNPGDLYDGERMVSYEDYVNSNEPSQEGHVAYSISPAVIWTLPRINSDSNHEIVLKDEIVALFR